MRIIKKWLGVMIFMTFLTAAVAFAEEVENITPIEQENKGDVIKGLNQPYGLAVDQKGTIYIADSYNNMIKKITSNGVELVAGGYDGKDTMGLPKGKFTDGEISKARFNKPRDLYVAKDGTLYVADSGNHAIRKIVGSKVYTVAGTGIAGSEEGAPGTAQFNLPSAVAMADNGELYVADTLNNCIRVIDTEGNTRTLDFRADGKTLKTATLNEPSDLLFDQEGTLYILDSGNQAVKKVKAGVISLVAGKEMILEKDMGYVASGLVNGTADCAQFNFPKGFAIDEKGNIFVSDSWNHCIRVITNAGIVRTLSGSSYLGNRTGDLTDARFHLPTGMVMKGSQLIVSDMWNNEVKAINIDYNEKAFGLTKAELRGHISSASPSESWKLWEDKHEVTLEKPILNKENQVLMPLKATLIHYGFSVEWDGKLRQVVIKKEDEVTYLDKQTGMKIYNDNSYIPVERLSQLVNKEFYVLSEERAIIGVDF